MKKTTIPIKGMHCRSCELIIEDNLSELPQVRGVSVNHKTGEAVISYKNRLELQSVQAAIEEAGYSVGRDEALPFFSKRKEDYNQLSMMAVAAVAIYFVLSRLGVFELGGLISTNYSSLPVVFLVGITAGLSTCMAIVGGLVLGASARFAKSNPLATRAQKISPHLYFNLGRVLGFMVLGGAIGWLGSMIQVSMSVTGFMTILVGLSMLILGAQLIDIFPRLSGWQFTLPTGISKALGLNKHKDAQYSHKNSMVLGALTFFLPCGFTQAMQLYAISSGSVLGGALTMAVFALGTAPGLVGIGGLAAVVNGARAKYFFRFAGLVVMAMAVFNISNGLNLTGLKTAASGLFVTSASQPVLGRAANAQVLQATYTARGGIQPAILNAAIGQPIKLEITALDSGAGCMSGVAIPGLTRQSARLIKGQTVVFEFTPEKVGTFPLVCTSMGMYHGSSIKVQ